jgi:hypothetical protein
MPVRREVQYNNISVRRWATRVGAFVKYLSAEEPFIFICSQATTLKKQHRLRMVCKIC